MFTANQNIALREHKRRVVAFVESTIPEEALEMGTMVMVMEVSCRAPGCVPLETVITIVFPRGQSSELIPGLPESGSGGNYKTKILMPLAEVSKDDVLDALPPQFEGGRRTMESLCLRARDVMLSQISQIMGDEDVEGKRLMAEYLETCLKDYKERNCVAPEIGEPFPPLPTTSDDDAKKGESHAPRGGGISTKGNFVIRRRRDDDDCGSLASTSNSKPSALNDDLSSVSTTQNAARTHNVNNNQNSVIRRVNDDTSNNAERSAAASAGSTDSSTVSTVPDQNRGENATEWRRRNKMEAQINSDFQTSTSQSIIQQLSEREHHAGGVRRPGCPCCDPDNPSNVVDNMMML